MILKRLAVSVLVLLAVSFVVFVFTLLLPGDPARAIGPLLSGGATGAAGLRRETDAGGCRDGAVDPCEAAVRVDGDPLAGDVHVGLADQSRRPEDEPVETVDTEGVEPDAGIDGEDDDDLSPEGPRTVIAVNGRPVEPEEDVDVIRPLPEKLVIELSAHRTIALRNAVGSNPHVAMTALLHKLARDAFRRSTHGATVQVSVHEVFCGNQGTDLKTTPYAKAVDKRHAAWKAKVPTDDDALWDWLVALDDENRMALLAHCMSLGINALYERPNPMSATGISERQLQARMAEADRLARVTGLDMAEAGFRPTVANYFGRVTKQRILEAIAEAVGESTANLLDNQKKDKMWMASEAEERLANTGWLPEPLRLASEEPAIEGAAEEDEPDVALPDFLAGDDEAPEAGTGEDPAVLVAAE